MSVQTIPFALQGASHGAELFRRAINSLLPAGTYTRLGTGGRGGIVQATDFAVSQHSAGNMSVDVAAGEAWVPGSSGLGANIGAYYALNDGTVNVAISSADPTNPRIDTVVLQVEDAQYTGSNNDVKLAVVTGTPTSGANLTNLSGKGAVPNNSLVLAYVLVPAGASSILTADLSDQRKNVGLTAACRAYRSAGTALSNSGAIVPFDTAQVDNLSGFNVSTHVYTVPVAGLYSVSVSLGYTATAGDSRLLVYPRKNSSQWSQGDDVTNVPSGEPCYAGFSDLVQCAAGDTLDVFAAAANSATPTMLAGATGSYLAILLESRG